MGNCYKKANVVLPDFLEFRHFKKVFEVADMDEIKAKKELPACLLDVMPGTKRFGELKKSVGTVSQKVLTAQLRAMEKTGLVHREVYAEVPPRVEYSLTELGKSLKPILDSMWAWGEEYKSLMSECCSPH